MISLVFFDGDWDIDGREKHSACRLLTALLCENNKRKIKYTAS
jgi:hypothetical protein